MPNYEYICSKCGATREDHRPMADRDRVTRCACGARMQRVIGPVPHSWNGCEWPGGWKNKGGDNNGG